MKTIKTIIICGLIALCGMSCYKDKGNYDIEFPDKPEITGLDSIYDAVVGDSLIISPTVHGIDPGLLEFEWRIGVPESPSGRLVFEGPSLRTIFGLRAQMYRGRLIVHNTQNGMKYFYNFMIQGVTEFTEGALVLSEESGISRLSFLRPNDQVQARIYEAIHQETLPPNPMHVIFLGNRHTGNSPLGFWVISKNAGVRLDVSTLRLDESKPKTLGENFFLAPQNIEIGSLQPHLQGVLMGVINGKFYGGTTTTWDQAATYGMFGTYAAGDYNLAPQFIMSEVNGQVSIIAFDKDIRQFQRINIYGSPAHFGATYETVNANIFNPKDVQMDLVEIVQINNADTYAYFRDGTGNLHELKFNVNFNGPFTFTSGHKRLFAYPELFTDNVKLIATRNGYIYFASGNEVYRYNPLNENLTRLDANFDGAVSMLKLLDDEQTLVVGTAGSLSFLAIQVGRNGDLIKKVEGIPGRPIDMAWRMFPRVQP